MPDTRFVNDDDPPAWLDQALTRTLVPPPLPMGLRERLRASARQDELLSLQQRHAALKAELALARRQLLRREMAVGLQTLGVAVTVSFAGGAAAALTLPLWLPWLGEPAAPLLPLLALGLGISTVGLALRMRWGPGGL